MAQGELRKGNKSKGYSTGLDRHCLQGRQCVVRHTVDSLQWTLQRNQDNKAKDREEVVWFGLHKWSPLVDALCVQ